MNEPIDILPLADAFALADSIPDVIDADGAKHSAQSVQIHRDDAASGKWRIQIPHVALHRLASGKVLREGLTDHLLDVATIAGQSVVLTHPDGRTFRVPLVLAHAILGALYVGLERGEITTDPAPALAQPAQEPTP
jgi:hypothetical protein